MTDRRQPTTENVPLAAGVRRFRQPLPIRVSVEEGKPVRVTTHRRDIPGGHVVTSAGPWRASGVWWEADHWNRDEWEVTLAGGETYRIFHDRDSDKWFLDGVVD